MVQKRIFSGWCQVLIASYISVLLTSCLSPTEKTQSNAIEKSKIFHPTKENVDLVYAYSKYDHDWKVGPGPGSMQDFGNDDTGLITISYNVVRTFSDTIFSELKIRNIGVRRNYIMEYVDSIYQIKYTDSSIIYLDTVIESKSTGNQIYFKDTTALGNWVQNLEIDVHTMSPVYFLPMYNNTSALKAINWNEKSLNVVIQSNCSDCKYKYLEGFGLASSVMATRIAMGRKSQSKHTLVRISGVTFDPSILPD